jgi:CubicO group peptidase (beta-lactamase class C family)
MRRYPILVPVLFLAIAGLLIHAVAAGTVTQQTRRPVASGAAPDIVVPPLGEKADAVLREAEGKGYSGVALVAKDGTIVLRKGYGLADRTAGIPMTGDTVIQIGSCTKDFTIVAILQLHERGLLNVKDPITEYFKDVPEDKRGITIWQLVTQQSGLIDHIGGDFEPATKEDIIRGALATTLLFSPGSDHSYSNMAFNLLAAIIEHVSKQSFDKYVRDRICAPLGLRDTGFLLPGFNPKRVAHGYVGDEDRGIMSAKPHATDGPYWNLRGAGGMLSTVTDMFRFYTALRGDKLMKPETRDLRFPPAQPMVLAGSDLVQYFFYAHEPAAGFDILLSSTSSGVKAPQVLDKLREALGMPDEKGTPQVETSPKTAKQPPTPEAQVRVDAFFQALASGDPEKFESMAHENYTPEMLAGRTPAERKGLAQRIRDDFGTLALGAVQMLDANTVAFTIRGSTDLEGRVELTLESEPPRRIQGVSIKVGD